MLKDYGERDLDKLNTLDATHMDLETNSELSFFSELIGLEVDVLDKHIEHIKTYFQDRMSNAIGQGIKTIEVYDNYNRSLKKLEGTGASSLVIDRLVDMAQDRANNVVNKVLKGNEIER